MKTELGLVSTLVVPGVVMVSACLIGIRRELLRIKNTSGRLTGSSENEC